jgi:hypothetical protein
MLASTACTSPENIHKSIGHVIFHSQYNYVILWSTDLRKVIFMWTVKDYSTFYEIWTTGTLFTTGWCQTLSLASRIQSTLWMHSSLLFTQILPSHLHPFVLYVLIHSHIPIKTLHALFFSPMHGTHPVHSWCDKEFEGGSSGLFQTSILILFWKICTEISEQPNYGHDLDGWLQVPKTHNDSQIGQDIYH